MSSRTVLVFIARLLLILSVQPCLGPLWPAAGLHGEMRQGLQQQGKIKSVR
jgi:hypothetical protein